MYTSNELNFLLYHLASRFFFWYLFPLFTYFSHDHAFEIPCFPFVVNKMALTFKTKEKIVF